MRHPRCESIAVASDVEQRRQRIPARSIEFLNFSITFAAFSSPNHRRGQAEKLLLNIAARHWILDLTLRRNDLFSLLMTVRQCHASRVPANILEMPIELRARVDRNFAPSTGALDSLCKYSSSNDAKSILPLSAVTAMTY